MPDNVLYQDTSINLTGTSLLVAAPANPRQPGHGNRAHDERPLRTKLEIGVMWLVMADSRGSLCSPKAGFGRIRLLARRVA